MLINTQIVIRNLDALPKTATHNNILIDIVKT